MGDIRRDWAVYVRWRSNVEGEDYRCLAARIQPRLLSVYMSVSSYLGITSVGVNAGRNGMIGKKGQSRLTGDWVVSEGGGDVNVCV